MLNYSRKLEKVEETTANNGITRGSTWVSKGVSVVLCCVSRYAIEYSGVSTSDEIARGRRLDTRLGQSQSRRADLRLVERRLVYRTKGTCLTIV